MSIKAKYVHTNLIAQDWRRLAEFYIRVFDCYIVPPERNFKGEKLEKGTTIEGAQLSGAHLRLPGYGDNGPTLEIFTYMPQHKKAETIVNRPGFGHIAFQVENVEEAHKFVIDNGGSPLGEIVTLQVTESSAVKWCYVKDPEGNLIELQSWHRQQSDGK